jgi:hypothetical protein
MQTPRDAFNTSVPSPWAAAWHLQLPVDGCRTVRNYYLSSRSRVTATGRRLAEALRRLVADRNLTLPQLSLQRDRDSLEARDRFRAGFVDAWGTSTGRHLPRPGVVAVHAEPSVDDTGPSHLHVGAAEAA